MSTAKKALKNGIWNAAEVSIYPFLQLLLMPVFLNYMGTIQFGFWMLANSIVGSFSLSYAGIVDASIWQIASAKSKAEKLSQKISQSLSTSLYIGLFAAFICILIGIALHFGIANFHWFGVNQDVFNFNPFTIVGLTLFSVIKIFEQSFYAVFKGLEKYEISSMFGLSSKMLILIANLIFAMQGLGLGYYFFGASIITLCSSLIAWRLLRKNYAVALSFTKSNMQLADNVRFAKWSWLQSIFTMLSNQIDKLIVSTYGGLEVLSFYSIGFMIFSQLHNLFAALGAWMFPFSARLKENIESFKNFKNNGLIISVLISMLLLASLSIAEKPIFSMWLGAEKILKAEQFIHYFIAFESIMLVTIIPFYLMNGSGYIKQNALMEAGFKITNVLFYVSLFYLLGNIGLMLGLIVSASLYVPIQHFYSNSLLLKMTWDKQSFGIFVVLYTSVSVYLLAFPYFQAVLVSLLAAYVFVYRANLSASIAQLKPGGA